MKEIERMEELKRKMMSRVSYRDGMPKEVISVIQEAFENILNKYSELQCNNLTIQKYIEGNLSKVKSCIMENLGENRKERQMEQVQCIVRKMERELEDKGRQEKHKEDICKIEPGDKKIASRIMGIIGDSLRDVQSSQNRILDANGFSMDRIESIGQEVQGFIRYFVTRNEGKVYEILGKDNDSLKEQLLSEYEQYLMQNKKDEKEQETEQANKSGRDKFVEGLDGGISLEEQRAFSLEQRSEMKKKLEQKQEKQGNQVEALPTDVII